jgi:hypothetical protein
MYILLQKNHACVISKKRKKKSNVVLHERSGNNRTVEFIILEMVSNPGSQFNTS